MPKHEWAEIIAVLLFTLGLLFFLIMAISGFAWVIIPLERFSYWMVMLLFILAVTAGGVGTYSFVSYFQTREIRGLMLTLMGLNIILWAFLFLVTHPSSAEWSVLFADRARNRTLGMGFVVIVIPPILLSSFYSGTKPNFASTLFLIIWGAIITPFISLWFFLSPEPVFLMTYPEGGGIEGITPIGMVISLSFLFSQILAAIRLSFRWVHTRDTLDLTLLLSLTHWITGTFFIIILWDPLQVAELLWVGSLITGYLLIVAVQFLTSILDPHKVLEGLLEERTRESEYYLNMWTHKMGNLLQGLVTYLDILDHAQQGSIEDLESRSAARVLSRDAILVNHQVLQLTSIKTGLHKDLVRIDLVKSIAEAIDTAEDLLEKDIFKLEYPDNETHFVLADDLLSLVFLNVIIYNVKIKSSNSVSISVSFSETDQSLSVEIKSDTKPIPLEVRELLRQSSLSGSVSLGLDLFTIKLLMKRYGGRIEWLDTTPAGNCHCVFVFPIPK